MGFSILLLGMTVLAVGVVVMEMTGLNPFRQNYQQQKPHQPQPQMRSDILPKNNVEENLISKNYERKIEPVRLNDVSVHNLVKNTTAVKFTAKSLPAVIKPPGDKRVYRSLELTNQMKVIVVSDPEADEAGAAVNVQAGSYHDPDQLLGLAHYLEHLLFLGTQKYPDEDDFGDYLTKHAGSTNAYTADSSTCYYYSLAPEGLEGALDRFAQFFIAPLFAEDLNEREVNAVNSEHEGSLVNEYWRKDRVNRNVSKANHPFRRFSTGNKDTLWTHPREQKIDVRTELIKFFKTHYSSNLMTLSVIGREGLDELQGMVEKYFSAIPNKNVPVPEWPDSPYGPDHLQRRIEMVPLMDLRQLFLTFPIPDYTDQYKSGALEYVQSLIGHGGPGSLSSLLKNKGLATSVYARDEVPVKGFGFFEIAFSLTPMGLENLDEIVLHTFQYLKMIRSKGVQKWFWEELTMVKATEFRFLEKQEAINLILSLVEGMVDYPTDEVLTSRYFITDYNPNLIETLLSYLVPEKVRILTQARENKMVATNKEPFMGVEFGNTKIDGDTIQKWTDCGLQQELKFPTRNSFIPSAFELKPRDVAYNGTIPKILVDDAMSRLWFLQDQEYSVPRATISLNIMNSHTMKSARNKNLQDLFVMWTNYLVAEPIYSASTTGLQYSIQSLASGIFLRVEGYDDKIGLLFDYILQFMLNFKTSKKFAVDEHTKRNFGDVKETYIRQLNNTRDEAPGRQARFYLKTLLHSQEFTFEEQLADVEELTLEDVLSYAQLIFSKVRLQWVIYGNMGVREAIEIHAKGLVHFKEIGAQPLLNSELPQVVPTQVKLPIGSNYLYKLEVAGQSESAVIVYLQPENVDLREEWIILLILDQIMETECFNILRTKEQLGYQVHCGRRTMGSIYPGYSALIQGAHHPNYTQARIHNFLQLMTATVNNLTKEEFIVYQNAVKSIIISERPKTLIRKSYAIDWAIEKGTFDFDQERQELKKLEQISLDQVLNFFNTWINPESEKRKMLTIHVVSTEAPAVEKTVKNQLAEKVPELILDVPTWKQQLGYFPVPKPQMNIPPWKETTVRKPRTKRNVANGNKGDGGLSRRRRFHSRSQNLGRIGVN